MKIKFTKMHGAGNDFIVVDARRKKLPYPEKVAKALCERHFAVGADGLILLLNSKKADYRMRIFNPDGSEPEMCGNGIRCFARYIADKKISKKTLLLVETKAGIIKPEILHNGVKVDMGEPILDKPNIPMIGNHEPAINESIQLKDRHEVRITAVSMGNPHAIIFVKDLDSYPVESTGRSVEIHSNFPNKTNVEFVEITGEKTMKVRVWERGVGETLACGTGACASLVASVLNGKIGRKANVHLPGGILTIEWDDSDNHVYMTGPAETVFEGVVRV
jgi:diaminopimelate epimerase